MSKSIVQIFRTANIMRSEEEKKWLSELSDGNQDFFVLIYNRYWKDLFITANKVTFSREIAEDLVQDVFVTLWEKRENLDHIKSLAGYLKVAIRNNCLQYIERHINRYNFIVSLPEILESVFADSNITDKIYMQEIEECISRGLDQMPKKMRKVFELSRNDLKSHKEIAEELNISTETVKKHIQHALSILKNNLDKLDSFGKALLIFYFLMR